LIVSVVQIYLVGGSGSLDPAFISRIRIHCYSLSCIYYVHLDFLNKPLQKKMKVSFAKSIQNIQCRT
jgi:hypothetical protein